MLVGCQATTPAEFARMLADFPHIGVVRLTEQTTNVSCATQAQNAGAKSIVLCNNYGSLLSQAQAAQKLPGVSWIELGNEPYWEVGKVTVPNFAKEAYATITAAGGSIPFAVACMSGTAGDPAALLKAEPRLKDVVTCLAVHPYDPHVAGPKGPAAQRFAQTHADWLRFTGKSVDIIATEFGYATPPFQNAAWGQTVTEEDQAILILAMFAELASHDYVKAATLFHYLGYDKLGQDTTRSPTFNGIVHWDYTQKPGWKALQHAIAASLPTPPSPPIPPFTPTVGSRTFTPTGTGTIVAIPDNTHVVVALDQATGSVYVGSAVLSFPASTLKATS